MPELSYVLAPKEAIGDDHVRIVKWEVPDGARVTKDTIVATVDTSKAAFEIETDADGFLFHLAQPGDRVTIGMPIAVVSSEQVRPSEHASTAEDPGAAAAGPQFTQKALELIERHTIPASAFAGQGVVRHSDVEQYMKSRAGATPPTRLFGSEELIPDADWDALLASKELASLQGLLRDLRRRLKAKFNRHVPAGTLLHDRWDVAREYGFGEGTSVYDECLILGDVKVGKHCWIGPFTVLDGNFASLRIGDYTSIGSGAHVYTHHTIDHAITRGQTPAHSADTTIGEGCFISPLVIVGPGSKIGDCSFVAAGSNVQGEFPEYSYIAHNPARRVGHVEIRAGRVFLVKDE